MSALRIDPLLFLSDGFSDVLAHARQIEQRLPEDGVVFLGLAGRPQPWVTRQPHLATQRRGAVALAALAAGRSLNWPRTLFTPASRSLCDLEIAATANTLEAMILARLAWSRAGEPVGEIRQDGRKS